MSDSVPRVVPFRLVADLAVAFAEAEARAGAQEIGGNNAGPFVEKYLNANHPGTLTHRGEPWCVAFFCWCWLQAERCTGQALAVEFTRGARELWARMEKHGLVLTRAEALESAQADLKPAPFTPAPGDAVFWDHNGNGDPDHVNMLHRIDDAGVLYTIGGNEGNEDSGAPVRIKKRGRLAELGALHGFGRMYMGEVSL